MIGKGAAFLNDSLGTPWKPLALHPNKVKALAVDTPSLRALPSAWDLLARSNALAPCFVPALMGSFAAFSLQAFGKPCPAKVESFVGVYCVCCSCLAWWRS